MRSSDRLPWRRRRLALAVAAAALLGVGSGGPARAQDGTGAPTGEALFGSYQLDARAVGLQGRYEVEGILPGGAPVIDLTIPETTTRFGSGPIGYGLAGLAYPGPLLADLGVLAAQGGFGEEDSVPPWPIKAEAFYPTGPTEVDESQGPAVQRVVSGDLGVLAQGEFPAVDAPPLVSVGSVTAASRSSIEGELAVSRSRVVLGDVVVLGGVIAIDSVVTDLVATHDGQSGSTAGSTTATGVRFLGLAAHLGPDGLVLEPAPAPSDSPAAPLSGLLDPVVLPLRSATAPVQAALRDVLAQAVPRVDDLLAQAGITIRLVEAHHEQVDSGAATLESSGLSIGFSYLGREQQAMVDLVNSIPPELRPSLGPLPNPVGFLAENHIGGLNLAPASVSALATPPFPLLEGTPVDGAAAVPLPSAGALGDPGFATAAPPVPGPGSTPAGPGAVEPVRAILDGAVPAVLVALALLASPLFAAGSARLADAVLAPAGASCPYGLEEPPDPRSRP